MAIETVAQNEQASFADPQNGTSPIDADEVTANDNALRAKHNAHDADATIHVQGSLLADRPTAGVAGRKWMTRDSGGVVRLFRDTGSVWEEVSYVPSASNATISGVLTFSTAPVFTNAQTFASDVTVEGNAVVEGDLEVQGSLTGTLSGITDLTASGTITATTFAGSGASLTGLPAANITGTLPAISGVNLTNLNASNIASGTLAEARLPATVGTLGITTELNIDNGAAIDFTAASGSPDLFKVGAGYQTATPPTGSATLYLRLKINGVDYRIECKSVA